MKKVIKLIAVVVTILSLGTVKSSNTQATTKSTHKPYIALHTHIQTFKEDGERNYVYTINLKKASYVKWVAHKNKEGQVSGLTVYMTTNESQSKLKQNKIVGHSRLVHNMVYHVQDLRRGNRITRVVTISTIDGRPMPWDIAYNSDKSNKTKKIILAFGSSVGY